MISKFSIRQQKKELGRHIDHIQSELLLLPPGDLSHQDNGKYTKWFTHCHAGSKLEYIPREKHKLAVQLARRKYYEALLKDLNVQFKAAEDYIFSIENNPSEVHQLLADRRFTAVLCEDFVPTELELSAWAAADYEHYMEHADELVNPGTGGYYLRSKSEVLIDTMLRNAGIPFRYEAELKLEDVILHPDFTIRHPLSGKFFYWEHFGRMDLSGYMNNHQSKIHRYLKSGIIPNINLICTYEYKDCPLSYSTVKEIINKYFLA